MYEKFANIIKAFIITFFLNNNFFKDKITITFQIRIRYMNILNLQYSNRISHMIMT